MGASHQSVEDIAIMRAIPNVTVIAPSDPVSTKKSCSGCGEGLGGPAYIRLGRAEMDTIYDEDFEFEVGKGVQLRDGGDDFTIVAVGNMVKRL